MQCSITSAENRFTNKLYSAVYDEASWLYEQRLGFYIDQEYQWADFELYETRLGCLLESLVMQRGSIEKFCLERLYDGDIGEVFVSVYVLAKRSGISGVFLCLPDFDFSDMEIRQAFIDAVNAALENSDKLVFLEKILVEKTNISHELVAQITSYNRLGLFDELSTNLKKVISLKDPAEHESVLRETVVALGKLASVSEPSKSELNFLYTLFEHSLNDSVLSQLAITLLKAKNPKIVSHLVAEFQNNIWPILPLGLYGHTAANSALWQLLNTGSPEQVHAALLSIGLLGNPDSINVCIQCLVFPDFSESAANALQLMTGANLKEEIFIPDEIDPDELFPDELERYEKGEPVYAEGEEPGKTVTQTVQTPEVWKEWFENNKTKFTADQRYRYGEVITPLSLLKFLKAPQTEHKIRALIVDELAIQFNIDVQIELRMFVNDQLVEIDRVIDSL